jgi:phosphoribosyl-dephospho-CoA transferase
VASCKRIFNLPIFIKHETIQHAAYNNYIFTITLETDQEDFKQRYVTSKRTRTPGKTHPVLFLTTAAPKRDIKRSSNKIAVYVVNKDTSQLNTINIVRTQKRILATNLFKRHLQSPQHLLSLAPLVTKAVTLRNNVTRKETRKQNQLKRFITEHIVTFGYNLMVYVSDYTTTNLFINHATSNLSSLHLAHHKKWES